MSPRSILALLALLAGCDGGTKGAGAYNDGIDSFKLRRYEKARKHFEAAIDANPEFSEAYLILSTTKVRLAQEAAHDKRNAEAGSLWRDSLADRKKAKALMEQGKFFVSDPADRDKLLKDAARAIESAQKSQQFGVLTDAQIADILRSLPPE